MMATYTDMSDVEELWQKCPYNPVHKVSSRRYLIHLGNCEQIYAHLGYKICPFNAGHRIPAASYENHVITCVDNRPLVRMVKEKTDLENGGQYMYSYNHDKKPYEYLDDVEDADWNSNEKCPKRVPKKEIKKEN